MGITKIKKGLDLPIKGKPVQAIQKTKEPKKVALLGADYVGMKPTMEVAIGDKVKLGQLLFTDKKCPGVKYISPASGKVVEINRGDKRVFQSIVIEIDRSDEITFDHFPENELNGIDPAKVKSILIDSGLWTSIRVRPYSKVAVPETTPHSIFVTAMDTNPLAPSIEKVLEGREKDFQNGLKVLTRLTEEKLYLCKSPGENIPVIESEKLSVEEFDGPHPAGIVGTHIHFLDPVSRQKIVWYVNAQDVSAIGYLFTTGKLNVERIISLGGSQVKEPALIKTRIGASLEYITNGELTDGENRIISGSVLSGFQAHDAVAYLGRYHQQVSVIAEDRKREFFGWVYPGLNLYSVMDVVLSKLIPNKTYDFSTSLHGGKRSIVPVGSYEKIMPLDIMPNYLLRSLAVDDVEEAEKLGCLELDEEDLALCTFVCPSKIDHGVNLRRNLTQIEKEG